MSFNNKKIENIELEIVKSKKNVEITINNILDREEKLFALDKKSKQLKDDSQIFYKKARNVKRKTCKDKYYKYMIFCFLFLLFIYIILSLSCGFDFSKCKI